MINIFAKAVNYYENLPGFRLYFDHAGSNDLHNVFALFGLGFWSNCSKLSLPLIGRLRLDKYR